MSMYKKKLKVFQILDKSIKTINCIKLMKMLSLRHFTGKIANVSLFCYVKEQFCTLI